MRYLGEAEKPQSRPQAALSVIDGVELRGFEPLTFSLRTRRATNCATAPCALEREGKVTTEGRGFRIGAPRGATVRMMAAQVLAQPLVSVHDPDPHGVQAPAASRPAASELVADLADS